MAEASIAQNVDLSRGLMQKLIAYTRLRHGCQANPAGHPARVPEVRILACTYPVRR